MSALELARTQFGITTLFHFIFVPLSIGTAFFVAVCQTLHLRTGKEIYARQVSLWGKVMLLSFAVGVVTGLFQEFQFGMNWAQYSRFVGDVFGAPLAMEGLAAFFLESTFIGLWIFGKGRISPALHLATIWCVAAGTMLSAFFIIVANSWMQHPVGFEIDPRTGQARLNDVWALLSNNTAIWAFVHVIFASLVTGAMVALGVAAWHMRRGHQVALFASTMRLALPIALVAVIGLFFSGDELGRLLVQQQPMKMAAAEALFNTEGPAAFSLVAVGPISCDPSGTTREVKIPHLLSILATRSWDHPVPGINNVQRDYTARYGPAVYTPCVPVIYWSFRTMVYLFGAVLTLALVGLFLLWRGRLESSPRFLRLATWAAVLPFLINFAGWIMTEMGRQPWIVQGQQKTADGVSPSVSTGEVWISLVTLTVVYGILGLIALWLFLREVRHGAPETASERAPDEPDLSLAY
jgi:cytochrome d ubiquinol oxidase subunit I